MRTLNRPMFNMGGPIKQGIMHGIREPYAGGTRAALVGNPVYPQTGGREHHQIAKTIFGFIPNIYKGAKPWLKKIKPGGFKFQMPQRLKPSLPKSKLPPGMRGRVEDRVIRTPRTNWEMAKQGVRQNPWWAGGAAVGATSDPGQAVLKAPYHMAKWGAEALTPGWAEKYLPWDVDGITELATKTTDVGTFPGSGEKIVTGDTSTEESRAAFIKKQRTQRVNKYLDLMGYDQSRHDAVSKALIDASKIVSDRGTLDKKNITRDLINPIIQATSKRFEKPAQIREAVGLMMVKADLEKEVAGAKPGTQLKAAQDYVAQFGGTYANAYKQLGLTKKGSWTESLSALSKAYGKGPKNQDVLIQNIMLQKEGDPDFDVSKIKVIGDQEMLDNLKKQEDYTTVSDVIMRTQQDDAGNVIPGIYMIGNAVIEVTETGIKQLN